MGLTDPLPDGAVLLHIGIPKTGTTALQRAAAARRRELLAEGLLYPGRGVNHREAVCALMGRTVGWRDAGGAVPGAGHWRRLRRQVRSHRGRVLISHEFAAESDHDQAARFADQLGERMYVAITLRGFAHLLGSSWQQYVKTGRRKSFPKWLRQVLADQPPRAVAGFYRRNDQAAIVRRWADVVGADRVVVVVADKTQPGLLTDGFEDLLGLSRGLLQADRDGFSSNRALSWPEAELLRRLNRSVGRSQLDWPAYDTLVRNGGVARLLERRQPRKSETPVALPAWAAGQATEVAARYADEIAAAGVRVVGDLDTLTEPVRSVSSRLHAAPAVPLDAAVQLSAGLVLAAVGRPQVGRDDAPDGGLAGSPVMSRLVAASHRVSTVPTVDLLVALGVRAAKAVSRQGRR